MRREIFVKHTIIAFVIMFKNVHERYLTISEENDILNLNTL